MSTAWSSMPPAPDWFQASIDACGRSRRLIDCPPAPPFEPHVTLFWQAVAHAKGLGLSLPAFELRWAHGGEAARHHGETVWYPSGKIVVCMNADLRYPGDVISTSLHELQHVEDAAMLRHIDRAESEWRAIEFAARAMECWR